MKQIVLGLAIVIVVAGITLGLSRLKPAAPSVERAGVWIDTVKHGPMLRQVRGNGTLVSQEIKWVPAATDGRVEHIFIFPGTPVKADSVLLQLSNPDLELSAKDAELQLKAAIAEFENQKAQLLALKMNREAESAQIKAQFIEAKLRAEADEKLSKEGLVADMLLNISKAKAEDMAVRYDIETRRLVVDDQAQKAQMDVQATKVDQVRAVYQLRRTQVEALKLRAGADGVLQQLPVEVGQRVTPGTTLAKIAQPDKLKAELRIAETQAKDILIGQNVSVDTRNGLIPGHVMRIDPAAENGTVKVDISLDGALPKGARPDLSVDGTIELEKLSDVLSVGRPASGQEQSTITLFKLDPEGTHASRVTVKLGRSSVNAVEILDGLKEGDRVVLSDMSNWDAYDSIRLE